MPVFVYDPAVPEDALTVPPQEESEDLYGWIRTLSVLIRDAAPTGWLFSMDGCSEFRCPPPFLRSAREYKWERGSCLVWKATPPELTFPIGAEPSEPYCCFSLKMSAKTYENNDYVPDELWVERMYHQDLQRTDGEWLQRETEKLYKSILRKTPRGSESLLRRSLVTALQVGLKSGVGGESEIISIVQPDLSIQSYPIKGRFEPGPFRPRDAPTNYSLISSSNQNIQTLNRQPCSTDPKMTLRFVFPLTK